MATIKHTITTAAKIKKSSILTTFPIPLCHTLLTQLNVNKAYRILKSLAVNKQIQSYLLSIATGGCR